MGLLSTAAIIAVIAIIIAGVVLYAFTRIPVASKLTVSQAEGLVINDIKAQNPTANVTLLPGVSNSSLEAGSFYIPLSVVYNGSSPCPTLLIEAFDYPATGLHPSNDTQLTSYSNGTCNVYIHGNLPPYAPLFIASSYASNNNGITAYVNRYGYSGTSVSATYQTNSTILGNSTNIWLIKYSGSGSQSNLYAIVDPSGAILQTYNSSS
jgi:hypothetical protein